MASQCSGDLRTIGLNLGVGGAVGLRLLRGGGVSEKRMKLSSGRTLSLLFLLFLASMVASQEEDYDDEEEEEGDYSGDYSDEDYSGDAEEDSGDYDYQYDYEREGGEGNSGDYYEYETK